jgi:multiple sugar transport system permease protein
MSAAEVVSAHVDVGRDVRRRHVLRGVVAHAVLVALGLLFFFPFFWLVDTSVKPDAELFAVPPILIPSQLVLENYPRAFTYVPFLRYTLNTLYLAAFNIVATLVSGTLIAYGFSRIQWPGRDTLFAVMLSTMMIPYAVTMIPTFIIFKWMGWVGSFSPLTWPAFTGSPFFIFLLRQFFMTIPQELSEAAEIDGCSELDSYWRIILPLAKPALATVALFTFIDQWNAFLGPLIYLNREDQYPLGVGLYGFYNAHGAEWALLMAASTMVVIPVIVLFFFTQRTFIEGISLTGIKG